jgi:precorrin-8X/cobalt-precorrin-8 methylmutase
MHFDTYVFVDWSARTGRAPARPRRDAVWVGSMRASGAPAARYCRTRAAGTELVRTFLRDAHPRGERVLVGFDFPYGYPRGLAAAAGLERPAWRATWDALSAALVDGEDNRSNRFDVAEALNGGLGDGRPGPFWGRPVPRRARADSAPEVDRRLQPTSPGFPFRLRGGAQLERLRECDRRLPGVQECWKLLGVGSVGSQALTGIPRVRSLRDDPVLAAASAVWPFETGFTSAFAAHVAIVHTEVWPGVVEAEVAQRSEPIRDQAQVLALCEWARRLDARGELGALFERPSGLHDAELRPILEEEGWVLGCRDQRRADGARARRRVTPPSAPRPRR